MTHHSTGWRAGWAPEKCAFNRFRSDTGTTAAARIPHTEVGHKGLLWRAADIQKIIYL